MNRFSRTRAALVLAAALTAHGLTSAEVSIVKIINFSCEFCRSSEAMDEPIRVAVSKAGGRMAYATVPADEASDGSRELVYYAARAAMPTQEPRIRLSLYKGAQDLGYPLATIGQTSEWLQTDLSDIPFEWSQLGALADGSEAQQAFQRALRVTLKAGAQVLPTYVVVKDGELVRTLDVKSAGGSYSALREAVIAAIEKASITKTSTPK